MSISCGTPKDVTPLDALSADVRGCSAGRNQQSSQTSVLASASWGTDSLDSFDEESSYSSTDKASVSTRTSASSSSSSEDSSLNGGYVIQAVLCYGRPFPSLLRQHHQPGSAELQLLCLFVIVDSISLPFTVTDKEGPYFVLAKFLSTS